MKKDELNYVTDKGIQIHRSTVELSIDRALDSVISRIDNQRGGLLKSSYEYPGRYSRWAIGFVNPPLMISTKENTISVSALNGRGVVLVPCLAHYLELISELKTVNSTKDKFVCQVSSRHTFFEEEARSRQPSIFTAIRDIMNTFFSLEDEHLGLYGTLGYDLIFQFEPIEKDQVRPDNQRDLVLYLPDELVIVDNCAQRAFKLQYEFKTNYGNTIGLPRSGEIISFKGKRKQLSHRCDHAPGEYVNHVEKALECFRRGDAFEFVLSQCFFQRYSARPSTLFQKLQSINPSPYSFIFNLGGEYLVGSSPEMFVRVEGRRVETCPISGTVKRGRNAIEDAVQVRQLLNSAKDEAELTMCTDVDRNDKSRVCEPGSVKVIGRRQIEFYSHVIHTVDHVEGVLKPDLDAIDAFLSHTWAVTVTGAPKKAAIQFIEKHERSPRRWYGGAIGYFKFNGDLNTGLVLRTVYLQDEIAEVRVGATLLYDSIPQLEEQETMLKAAGIIQALESSEDRLDTQSVKLIQSQSQPAQLMSNTKALKVLLIDHEDSFIHTLANYFRQTGASVTTIRHGFPESYFNVYKPELVVLSPGPGRPHDFQVERAVEYCVRRSIPLFGVCLGLQGIVEAFGGELDILENPCHGKSSLISVDLSSDLFKGLPHTFEAGRYHSLYAVPNQMPVSLKITARSADNVVMAIEHKTLPIKAVQFHPESIMTVSDNAGLTIIKNMTDVCVRSPSRSCIS
ncbi:anthranilate synthase [Leptolyngbya sp. Heron Island J]|uniref:anthranilate synthase component I n=1 Tax=Leptolyngbya sp. Heron Island J TaxID=1385935 RepID=UPI0003B944D9|nr:anthranilate synthase component I [Leptolyngbya sp. Heron Island J]ESA38721.1 anthranilate synthase [Leptolyngbya sp. Heron Island J]